MISALTRALPRLDGQFLANRSRRYWLCQLAGWGGVFALSVLVAIISSADSGNAAVRLRKDILFTGFTCLGGFVFSHALRTLMNAREWMRLPARRLWLRLLLAWGTGTAGLCWAGRWLIADFQPDVESPPLIACLMMNGLLLGMWICVYVLYHIQEAWTLSKLRESQLRTSGIEAQIAALQAQTTPHFLFNALNVIRALLPLEATPAREAITALAALLRSCLVESRKRSISLAEDLAIMRTYLDIERLRFESSLRLVEEIDPEALPFQVPPLLCLTLAENAVKHGLQNSAAGGPLRVVAHCQGIGLELCFENPASLAKTQPVQSLGLGLRNLSERVRLIHGEESSVTLSHDPAGTTTRVVVRLLSQPRPASPA